MTRSLAAAISQMRARWLILAALGIQAPVLAQGIPAGVPARQAYMHGYKIVQRYDRFDDRTTVSLDSLWYDLDGMEKQTFYWLTPRLSYSGQRLPESVDSVAVELVMLLEMNATRDPRTGELDRTSPFADPAARRLVFLVDGGHRIELVAKPGEAAASQGLLEDARMRTVRETLVFPVAVADWLAIVNAGTIEAKLGPTKTFKLDKPKQREGLRDFTSRLRAGG